MAKKAKKTTTEPVSETKGKATMADDTIVTLDMNLADYEDFEPLPEGSYPVKVTQAEMRTKEETGNDYYYVVLQIHPDDYPADYDVENAPDGTNLTYARLQRPSPKNRRSITAIKKWFEAIGMSTKTTEINPGDWEGKSCKANVNRQEWPKDSGNKINSIVSLEALD